MLDSTFERGWLRAGLVGKRKQRLKGCLRPDRLIIDMVRAGEAFDIPQAMNTGNDGSMTRVHAKGTGWALERALVTG